jgi:serine carboxypeptidase-like clade I
MQLIKPVQAPLKPKFLLYCLLSLNSLIMNVSLPSVLWGFFLTVVSSSIGVGGVNVGAKTAAPLVSASEDSVLELPLYGPPPTPQYSGYLDIPDDEACAENATDCGGKMHYWLALAEDDPQMEKPILLWLNGGPGSSSVIGFLQELGPLLINATGGLMENPWSWTRLGYLLILESPFGVGYSYCKAMYEGEACENTDRSTAKANRIALQKFFQKFPELASNKLYLTGESYAGVYIPTLAQELLENAPEISLAGIAVGDPCTDNESQQLSMSHLWYGFNYGLVEPDVYKKLMSDECLVDGEGQLSVPECRVAWSKYLISSSYGIKGLRVWNETFINKYDLYNAVDPLLDYHLEEYMTRDDVKKALHVESSPSLTWPTASQGFHYTKEYRACNREENVVVNKSMVDIYREIAPKLEAVWIFNGDADPTVSYEGTRVAVSKKIGFDVLPGGSYRPWFYNHTAAPISTILEKSPSFGQNLSPHPLGSQFGGEVENYQNGLTFLTVHGSGHMVPQFRPQASFHFMSKFLSSEPLSPPLMVDDLLQYLDEETFFAMFENWTAEAKSPPFVVDSQGIVATGRD